MSITQVDALFGSLSAILAASPTGTDPNITAALETILQAARRLFAATTEKQAKMAEQIAAMEKKMAEMATRLGEVEEETAQDVPIEHRSEEKSTPTEVVTNRSCSPISDMDDSLDILKADHRSAWSYYVGLAKAAERGESPPQQPASRVPSLVEEARMRPLEEPRMPPVQFPDLLSVIRESRNKAKKAIGRASNFIGQSNDGDDEDG